MSQKMTREELVDLVETITTMRNKSTNELLSEKELVLKFEKNINHSGGSDLLFYPELVGLPSNATVDEIVDLAMKEIEE